MEGLFTERAKEFDVFSIVGCRECSALWIVEGRPDSTSCRRCGKRYAFDRLKTFATAEGRKAAREARTRLLAERSGEENAFEATSTAAADVEEQVVSDEEVLEARGIDPEAVEEAADRERDRKSRKGIVLEALRQQDAPSEAAVVEYATARDVPAEYVRKTLAKLVQAGEVSRSGDRYRLL